MNSKYNKAIVAALSGLVTVAAIWVPGIETIMTPEVIVSLGTLIGTFLVYQVPNKGS